MHADYETQIHFSGTDDECAAFLDVLSLYKDRKHSGAYFSLSDLPEIRKQKTNTFDIIIGGPWGSYSLLNDVGLFREIAEAAPDADFKGIITGSGTYEEQSLKAILKDRKLYIETTFFSYEEMDDGYINYVESKLPYRKFVKLFKIEDEDFDRDTYEECLGEMLFSDEESALADFGYEDFCEAFGDDLFDEETFDTAHEEIVKLNLKCGYEYRESEMNDFGSRYIYDPIAKAYIKGNPMPAGVVDMTDAFKEQLEKQGSDKEPGDLTLEEAYDLLDDMLDENDACDKSEETKALFKEVFSDKFFDSYR